jgi:hypothetical protein
MSLGRTLADQFAETLAAAGVKRIYGIVGDSLNRHRPPGHALKMIPDAALTRLGLR